MNGRLVRPVMGFLSASLIGVPLHAQRVETTTAANAYNDGSERRIVLFLPSGDVFRPLLSDPKQPQFSASYLRDSSPLSATGMGVVAFGTTFGLVRWPGSEAGDGLQVSLAGGVFAQFDLTAPRDELVNADWPSRESLICGGLPGPRQPRGRGVKGWRGCDAKIAPVVVLRC